MSEELKPGALEYGVWTENNKLHYEIIIMRENEKKLVSEFSEYKREAEMQRDALRSENERMRAEIEKYADEKNWDYVLVTKEDLSQTSFLCWIGEKRPYAIAREALAESDPK